MNENESSSQLSTSAVDLRIAGWHVHASRNCISQGEETVRLEPRTMAVLVRLAGKAGEVVTRQEFEDDVWQGGVVGYDVLSNSIGKLRKAFGDNPKNPQIIETIPKVGYRLIADVGAPPADENGTQATAQQGRLVATTRPPCPYPGMVPFRAGDARFFYGRDTEINLMVQALRRQRFMMVIGPSGSGKSSLVNAGLLPRLSASRYFTDGYWLIRHIRPGARPHARLAELFGVFGDSARFEHDTVNTLLEAHVPAQCLLLVVDQFEEVFAQAERDEGGRFIKALQRLRAAENCALLITVRADFYPDLMNSYLWPVDASQRVEVAPLHDGALREAIRRPAAEVGVRVEENLVNQLLADAADEPGVLPLLQETMGLLWDEMDDHALSTAVYEKLKVNWAGHADTLTHSGLAVAIAMKADAALAELSPAQQAIARRIFLRMVQFGEGRADTRRQQPATALHAADDDPELFEQTLEQLTAHRLLTRSGSGNSDGGVVDIAHEWLISGWARLREWVEERREAEQSRRRLEAKAAEWVRLGRGTGGILDEAALPEAERWLTSPDAAYLGYDAALPELVQASRTAVQEAEREKETIRRRELAQSRALAAEQQQRLQDQAHATRRFRHLSMALASVFLVALLAAVFAWDQAQKAAEHAGREADAREIADSRRLQAHRQRLASIAQTLLLQAPQQMEILRDERAVLLARQARLLSRQREGPLRDQADRVLRTLLSKPYFGPDLGANSTTEAVAFSPDGRRLATSHMNLGKILLWDLTRRGTPPTELPGYPGGAVHALAFSPKDNALVAGNLAGTLLHWDLSKPQATPKTLVMEAGGIASLDFSPDGRLLALGARQTQTARVLDLDDRSLSFNLPLSADDGPHVSLSGSSPGGVAVAFSPDGNSIGVGQFDGAITLWALADRRVPARTIRGHQAPVWSLAFNSDGSMLVSGSRDGIVALWDLRAHNPSPVLLRGHEDEVVRVDFSPDGKTVASCSLDNTVRLWSVAQPSLPADVLRGHGQDVIALAYAPTGDRLASGSHGSRSLRLWDLTRSSAPRVLRGHSANVSALAFSADGRHVASTGADKTVHVWDLRVPDAPPMVTRTDSEQWALATSPDGRTLATGSKDARVQLWRLGDTMREAAVFEGNPDGIWSLAFSADGNNLAFAAGAGKVHVLDLAKSFTEPVVLQTDIKGWMTEVVFSPDGGALASTGAGGTIYLHDLDKPDAPPKLLQGHRGVGWSVAFSPDGKMLASAGDDDTVRLWKLGDSAAAPVLVGRHDDDIVRVRFSPDGKRLASASKDWSVRLWDVERPGVPPALLYGHKGNVWIAAFSPDGNTLATAGSDRTIRLWDMTHPVMRLPTDGLADLVCEKVWRNLTLEEWHQFVAEDIPYARTCPNLPVHPSVIDTARERAKKGDVPGAVALFQRAAELDSDLDLNPRAEAERLAGRQAGETNLDALPR